MDDSLEFWFKESASSRCGVRHYPVTRASTLPTRSMRHATRSPALIRAPWDNRSISDPRIQRHELAVKPHQFIRRMAHVIHEIARTNAAVVFGDHFQQPDIATSSAVTITGPKVKNVSILFARVRYRGFLARTSSAVKSSVVV